MAFYQTHVFGEEAYAVNFFGPVREIRRIRRTELFPLEAPNRKSGREYYQVFLDGLHRLENPIPSKQLRRIVFIPTTLRKLKTATEINDLFDDSPLEDLLWEALRKLGIAAERQWDEVIDLKWYFLDFALFCQRGMIDVETDGDRWHADTVKIPKDNERNNALASRGWHVLRFNGMQIRESTTEYCIPKITETIAKLGGLKGTDRRIYIHSEDGTIIQTSLFEDTESK